MTLRCRDSKAVQVALVVGAFLCSHAASANDQVQTAEEAAVLGVLYYFPKDKIPTPKPTDLTKEFRLRDGQRFILSGGDKLAVYADACAEPKVTDVTFKEEERELRILGEIKKIIKHYTGTGPGADAACGEGEVRLVKYEHELELKRANVKVVATSASGQDAEYTVVTGPAEHWFLSLDLPVTNRDVVKYDSTSGTLQPKETEPQLYFGINYLLGDVLSPAPKVGALADLLNKDNLSVKLMLRASSKPLDSIGLGLGYNLPAWDSLNLSALSVFIGHFWTKTDSIVGGIVQENSHYEGSWRFGISLNLDDALGYVKK